MSRFLLFLEPVGFFYGWHGVGEGVRAVHLVLRLPLQGIVIFCISATTEATVSGELVFSAQDAAGSTYKNRSLLDMNHLSKRILVTFVCVLAVVVGTFLLSTSSLAQEKAKTKQKSDKERITALEEALRTNKEQAGAITVQQQTIAQLERRIAQLEVRMQQNQQDLVNTHQRDVSNLNQQIMRLDQQVRMRRM